MRTPKIPLIAFLVMLLISIAHSANATVRNFTFTGTITSFFATDPFHNPLPNLASPGDPFTGTAFFDTQAGPFDFGAVGFSISVNGQNWSGSSFRGGPGLPQNSFLTPTEIFIGITEPTFSGPYGTFSVAVAGGASLSASLTSGMGLFSYAGDTGSGTVAGVNGDITSFQAVPDLGRSGGLLGIGLLTLIVLRRKLGLAL